MRWRGNRQSDNIEDRRGMRGPTMGGLGGGGLLNLLPMVLKLLGPKGGIIALLGIGAFVLFSGDLDHLSDSGDALPQTTQQIEQSGDERELVQFVSVVLADTEDTWHELFRRQGKRYQEPRLVLFRGATRSACGLGQAAMGPFYCPADRKVYIDLGFYDELRDRFQAPGDFAQAYVIAHEVGHHVQTLLGISEQVRQAQQKLDQVQANRLSVRQELQADCLAGIWAYHTDRSRQLLETGDVEEGLTAASAIGDERLQQQTSGYVSPDTFTHGSSAQRVEWFKRGLQSGRLEGCDTFADQSI